MSRNHRQSCAIYRPPTPSGNYWCCDCHLTSPVFVSEKHDDARTYDGINLRDVFDIHTTIVGGSSEPASYGQGVISTVTLQTFHTSMQESRQWERNIEHLVKLCHDMNESNQKEVI